MDWNDINGFLNSQAGMNITNSVLGIKSPKVQQNVATPQITVQTPVETGMSKSTMIMLAVGLVVVVGGLLFAFKKK